MRWEAPEWGDHYVAVACRDYEATRETVETFFGRPLARYSYQMHHDGKSFVVFSFPHRDDAALCLLQFEGEAFDPRDKGRGVNWMKWYKGRWAKRERNRSPYDFSQVRR
jgi:hypothetical protein